MQPSSPSTTDSPPALLAAELQRAFLVFNEASAGLTQKYEALQQHVTLLTDELAVANGELRRQFQEKEALSERLSLLLNALPAGVVVLNDQAVVTEANPVAKLLFGETVVGEHWGDVVRAHLQPTRTLGEWERGSQRLSVAESSLDSSGGKLLLVHDITTAHGMKAELERSQRLAAMGEMAASLAHQLRTPLATALLYSANLGEPELSPPARKRFSEKTTAQLQRLERLIQDTLLFARGQSIGRDVFRVDDWLEEVAQTLRPLCQEKGVEFLFQENVAELVMVGARKALYGALVNLLENALRMCETGTRIWLEANCIDDHLCISVRDEGPGVPDTMRTRIFEPFFTTHGQGTGLGLPIALGVARAHGGNIELLADAGCRGAEFVLTLPFATEEIREELDLYENERRNDE